MTPHLSTQDDIPMCQECGRDSSKYPRWLSAEQMDDDCNSISITPKKMSNKSKNRTLSGCWPNAKAQQQAVDLAGRVDDRLNQPRKIEPKKGRFLSKKCVESVSTGGSCFLIGSFLFGCSHHHLLNKLPPVQSRIKFRKTYIWLRTLAYLESSDVSRTAPTETCHSLIY